jgi:hypothetical protein
MSPIKNPVADPRSVTLGLLAYCKANDWSGHDPYDALNSRVFNALPFLDCRWPRLVLMQALKRSPVNVRPLLLVPKTQNPKALALFLGGMLKLHRLGLLEDDSLIDLMAGKLEELRSRGTPHWNWGYSFPWQTRTILVPRASPNLVCTIFVTNALLDLYETKGGPRYLEMAVSAAEYISTLCWTGAEIASFSYPLATQRSQIHNANLLGAALLARVAKHSGRKKFSDLALKVARWSASKQRADGSWPYGERPRQQWIDNFHTGYNLSGLRVLGECAGTSEFESRVRRGFAFYREHFFLDDGTPRYYHDKTYPIDVHCVAQSIITLIEFKHLDPDNLRLARSVYDWAMSRMHDERGFFYYRVLPWCTIQTSYMRWSQAWMFLALATLTEEMAGSGRQVERASAKDQVLA